MKYKHTQIGYLILFISVMLVAFYVWLYLVLRRENEMHFFIIGIMILTIFILASFSTLTVKVDEQYLRIKFGYGILQKKFSFSKMISAKKVKNRWYYGWGVRVWFWPFMMIFNVSGFDAVEIRMQNGKIYRIGTDAPDELEKVILSGIHEAAPSNVLPSL